MSRRLGRRTVNSGEMPAKERLSGSDLSGRCVRKDKRTRFDIAARVLLAGLVIVLVSGCGRYKEDLEQAKKQIDTLTADNKKCSETTASLEKEKQRWTEERQAAEKKIDALQKELSDLKKTNASLADERKNLTKKNSELSKDLFALKREKAELSKQVEELKARTTQAMRPEQTPKAGRPEGEPLRAAGAAIPKAPQELTPCKAVLAFMKASEKVIREYRGGERTSILEKVKQEYGPRMKGAPQKAIQNAKKWVDELSSAWDKPGGGKDAMFNLLRKRNAVLDACKIKPADAGF